MLVYDDLAPMEKIKVYDKRVEVPPHYDTFAEFHYSYHYGDVYSPAPEPGGAAEGGVSALRRLHRARRDPAVLRPWTVWRSCRSWRRRANPSRTPGERSIYQDDGPSEWRLQSHRDAGPGVPLLDPARPGVPLLGATATLSFPRKRESRVQVLSGRVDHQTADWMRTASFGPGPRANLRGKLQKQELLK